MITYTIIMRRCDDHTCQTIEAKRVTAEQLIELMLRLKDEEDAEDAEGI